MSDNQLVPLGAIAAELGTSIDTLARRVADAIVIDAVSGLRCIEADICREHIARHHDAAREIHRQALERAAQTGASVEAMRERVRAIQRQQERLGPPVEGEGGAFAVMLECDGARDAQLNKAARDRAEMTGGRLTYHQLNEGNR
ncbi:hypothetical protein [Mycobacterium sp. 1164985.4]|uniref:hypothetical protein n=1 Tax=Mycobacterium sp. 1164985.4 TaxID=1834069 RepID=UPI0007FED546|nr:hypothetical protein [Mycobacterium sp. 1164985.4]OBK78337.1 hypothetical protein A5650_10825 [Mycobacterium sp. 1164985.4]